MNYKIVALILNFAFVGMSFSSNLESKDKCGSAIHLKKLIYKVKEERKKILVQKLQKIAVVLFKGMAEVVLNENAKNTAIANFEKAVESELDCVNAKQFTNKLLQETYGMSSVHDLIDMITDYLVQGVESAFPGEMKERKARKVVALLLNALSEYAPDGSNRNEVIGRIENGINRELPNFDHVYIMEGIAQQFNKADMKELLKSISDAINSANRDSLLDQLQRYYDSLHHSEV